MRTLLHDVLVLTLAVSTCACSAIIDSDKYVGGGMRDGGTATDGGVDASVDLCDGVMCAMSETCDPLDGTCTSCDPECLSDQVCVAGACVECDGDDDGAFADGRACERLRGVARADCNDDAADIYPDAPIICGDSMLNSCPDPALSAMIAALGGTVELGRRPPMKIEGVDIAEDHPWVSVDHGTRSTGTIAFVGRGTASMAPGLAFYDLDAGTSTTSRLDAFGDLTIPTGFTPTAVTIEFASTKTWLSVLMTGTGGVKKLALYELGDAMTTTMRVAESDVSGTTVPPIAIGRNASGVAAIACGSDSGGIPAVVRLGGGSMLTVLTSSALSLGGGFLEAHGDFILAPTTDGDRLLVGDATALRLPPAVDRLMGAPDVLLMTTDPMVVRYIVILPTMLGLRSMRVACSGFPLDLSTCDLDVNAPVGIMTMDATIAAARADAHAFAAVASEGGGLNLYVFDSEGAILAPGSTPVSTPLLTATRVGAPVQVLDVAATSHYFPVMGAEMTVMSFVSTILVGTERQLWVTAIEQCAAR